MAIQRVQHHLALVQRQLGHGALLHKQEFDPWGNVRAGDVPETTLDDTGQRRDTTGLRYYNARYDDPVSAHFISADTIAPIGNNPQTRNRYSYTLNNPVTYNDPSGHCVEDATTTAEYKENTSCYIATSKLQSLGFSLENMWDWESHELNWILSGIRRLMKVAGWSADKLKENIGSAGGNNVTLFRRGVAGNPTVAGEANSNRIGNRWITLYDNAFDSNTTAAYVMVHEVAHIWDRVQGYALSSGMKGATGSTGFISRDRQGNCNSPIFPCYQAAGTAPSEYAKRDEYEDWAESVTATVFPKHPRYLDPVSGMNSWDATGDYTRRDYVKSKW